MDQIAPRPLGSLPAWSLQDAKARLSEVVRIAREAGPQRVTTHGRDAAVVVSAEDYARLVPSEDGVSLWDAIKGWRFADDEAVDAFNESIQGVRSPVRPLGEFGE